MMDFKKILEDLRLLLKFGNDHMWKDKQVECLQNALNNKDILAVLPTGYGKSAIFQSLPFIKSAQVNGHLSSDKCEHIVVVVTPLNSIMLNQITKLAQMGIRACSLEFSGKSGEAIEEDQQTCKVSLNNIKQGMYNIVYAHPESLLSAAGRDLMKAIRPMVCYLVVDEAHMIVEW